MAVPPTIEAELTAASAGVAVAAMPAASTADSAAKIVMRFMRVLLIGIRSSRLG